MPYKQLYLDLGNEFKEDEIADKTYTKKKKIVQYEDFEDESKLNDIIADCVDTSKFYQLVSEIDSGELMLTIRDADIQQVQTQKNKGGMSDVYLDKGTYLKSFYTILYSPSCVKISVMGESHKRIHHKVLWNYCAPKIISERYKK